jgi:Flp pilus assembly secretin CpaC
VSQTASQLETHAMFLPFSRRQWSNRPIGRMPRHYRPALEELTPRILPAANIMQTLSLTATLGHTANFDFGPATGPTTNQLAGHVTLQANVLPSGLIDLATTVEVLSRNAGFGEAGDEDSISRLNTDRVQTTVDLPDGQSQVLSADTASRFSVQVMPHLVDAKTVSVQVAIAGPFPGASRAEAADTLSLTTQSGRPADLLVGAEQSVPGGAGQGAHDVDIGTQLHFVPIVLPGGRIFLQVQAENTALNEALGTRAGGSLVAGHTAQRVSSSLNLADGQTLIIGQDSDPDFAAHVSAHVIDTSVNGPPLVQLQVHWSSSRSERTEALHGEAPVVFSVVTLSGRTGELLVGGEQAVPQATGIRFVDVGTHLTFLPIVLGNGSINLQIDTSQSALEEALGVHIQGAEVAGHGVDRVHTTVQLQDGQSLVLAQDDSLPLSIQVTPHLLDHDMVLLEVRAVERIPARPGAKMPHAFSAVALSGRTSELLIGGEQAVPQATGIQFVDVGTHLAFVPLVLGNGTIFLQIDTSQSALDEALGVHIPGGKVAGHAVERVRTTVELRDGQSLVLAQDDSAPLSIQVTLHLLEHNMVLLEVRVVGRRPEHVRPDTEMPHTFSAVALSGRASELLVGGEQAQLQGAGGIQFVAVGTDLNWVPIVLRSGLIHLVIRLDLSGGGPASQHINTAVDLADGQTQVIAQDVNTGFSVTIAPHLLDNGVVRLDVVVVGLRLGK